MSGSNSTQKKRRRRLSALVEWVRHPVTTGVMVTLLFLWSTSIFYDLAGQIEEDRLKRHPLKQFVFNTLQFLDYKVSDLRFKVRGFQPISDEVALLTIDDRALEQIERWPWSREKMAYVIHEMARYGAKGIGFDIIFSEPQNDQTVSMASQLLHQYPQAPTALKQQLSDILKQGHPDAALARAITEHKDIVILGAFNEEETPNTQPYQDYCRNEAFRRDNADKFVKPTNLSFIVNDEADPFVELEFSKPFEEFFLGLEEANKANYLQRDFMKNINDLNEFEQRKLNFLLQEANMHYCDLWLTEKDPNLDFFKQTLPGVFAKSKDLIGLPIDEAIARFKSLVLPLPIQQKPRWTINTDQLQSGADYTSVFNATQDSDGTIRRTSLFYRTGNRFGTSYIPSLALQTYLTATGYRANIEINVDPKYPNQKIIKKFEVVDPSKDPEEIITQIPVDEAGMMKINYAGPRNMYPYLSAKELFNGKETAEITKYVFNEKARSWGYQTYEVNKAEFIGGRSFIFGATAVGVYDLRVTPFDPNYPGPETHLNALANLFEKNFISKHPSEEKWMPWIIFGVGVTLSAGVSLTTAIPGFLLTISSLACLFFLDQLLFQKGLVATTVLPGLLIFGLFLFLFFYKYLTEERKKRELKSTFAKYVSPAIVDEILKDPENIELGGKKQYMTVFFSDLRNFTTISEKLQPTELSDVLNLYLTPMTQIVFANKGTLDKYIGDAVMAFFGAPIEYPDHAIYACKCALASLNRLETIRKQIETKYPGRNIPIEIGIGINTADVSVGNMGSDIVRSYTVMGDGVNLASRLEGITKEYGVKVVISEFTYEQIKNDFICRELDWVRVKGKLQPVKIYELLGEKNEFSARSSFLQLFNQGYQSYRQKDFLTALQFFRSALDLKPKDLPSEIYIERCEDYLKNPPPTDWDGVYVMKTK
ncbi:MAG: adenylate/guanylate cyclase domain-containing protein [Proteobacteria bacterium]|jgi:adenylate cyclase|nr:adenylate/guanylate cyclase domain-containing protein [Pseudomonadota bacterium]